MRASCSILRPIAVLGLVTAVLAIGWALLAGSADKGMEAAGTSITFSTRSGTAMSVSTTPVGEDLLITILGDIYLVSAAGGQATPLIKSESWFESPMVSPNGELVAFTASDTSPEPGLWIASIDGAGSRRISSQSLASPTWLPNSQSLIAHTPEGSTPEGRIRGIALDGNPISHKFYSTSGRWSIDPVVASQGESLYFIQLGFDQRVPQVVRKDLQTGVETILSSNGLRYKRFPRISPSGLSLAYLAGDGPRDEALELRILDLESGTELVLAELRGVGPGTNFDYSADGTSIFISSGAGEILRINSRTGERQHIPFFATISKKVVKQPVSRKFEFGNSVVARQVRWPQLLPGDDQVVYGAFGKVWLESLDIGKALRLTGATGREYSPNISSDGKLVVLAEWNDRDLGMIRIVNLETGVEHDLLQDRGLYASPTWSPNMELIAYYSSRQGDSYKHLEGSHDAHLPLDIRILDVASGKSRTVSTLKVPRSWQIHRFQPLHFSEDGTRLFYKEPCHTNKEGCNSALVSTLLDGSGKLVHMFLDSAVDLYAVSPDEQNIAAVRRGHVHLVTLPNRLTSLDSHVVDFDVAEHDSIGHGNFVSWSSNESLVLGYGNELYSWKEEDGQAKQLAVVSLEAPRCYSNGVLSLENAQVITLNTSTDIVQGTVIIEDGRISAIDSSGKGAHGKKASKFSVDIRGLTVIPALVDAHTHIHQYPTGAVEYFPEAKREYIANLAYGVTTVFDPYAPTVATVAQADLVDTGNLLGPRVYTSGRAVDYHSQSFDYVPLRSMSDASDEARRLVDNGAIAVKSYGHQDHEKRKWLVRGASEQGVAIIGHAQGNLANNVSFVVEGFSIIEHWIGGAAGLNDDVIKLFARSGVHITPTINVSATRRQGGPHRLYTDNWRPSNKDLRFLELPNRPSFQNYEIRDDYVLERALDDIAAFSREGGELSLGSHSATPGLALHWEMWLLAELGGLSATEVLMAASIGGAEKIGFESELGSIEKGKSADFLVLRCNPLDNIRCTAEIEYVVKSGYVWHADSMTQMWPVYKPFPKPWWHSDEDWEELKPELPKPWNGVPIAEGAGLE